MSKRRLPRNRGLESEERLWLSEDEFRPLFEMSAVGVAQVSPEGRYLRVNRKLCDMLGYSERELLQLTFLDVTHPDDRAISAVKLESSLSNVPEEYSIEKRCVRKDSSIIWVVVNWTIVRDVHGKALHTLSIVRDMSAREQAEGSLREKARLLDLANDTVMVRDLNDVITFWNRGAEEMYGYAEKEAVGQISHTLLATTFPKPLSEIKAEVFRAGRWEGELIHVRRDGARLTVASRWSMQTDNEGRFIGILEINNDISRRKEAEEALQKSELFNQAVLGSLGANIAVLDKNGDIIAVNKAWKRFAWENDGPALAETIGGNYLEACRHSMEQGNAEARRSLDGILEVLSGERQDFQIEYPCHSPREKRWFLMSVMPLVGERGGAVVTHTNITKRKQVEEALQENEECLKLAMEAGDIGTFDWNIQTNEVSWTEQSKATFGQPYSASSGLYRDWAMRVHPEDLPVCEASIKAVIRNKQNHWQGEYRMTNGDAASHRWVHSQGRIFYDDRGEPVRMIGVNMDITESKRVEEALRQSEARLRQLADAMPQIVYTCGVDGMADYANRQWYEYTGLSPEESMGHSWKNAIHPDDQEPMLRDWSDAMKAGVPFECLCRIRSKDGRYRWHLSRTIPIRSAEKQVVKWIGTSTDIHDRKQAEAEREELLAREQSARSDAEHGAERIRRLQAVTDSALRRSSQEDLLRDALARVRELLETDSAAILLTSEDGRSLIVRATVGLPDGALGFCIPSGQGLAGVIAATRAPLVVEDISKWDVINPILRQHARSVIGAPLIVDGRLIGVIHADVATPRRFTENDVRLLQLAADHIALAIDQTRLYEVELRARRQAEEANRMKDEFLALVSHELRSPLNAMLGYARLLRHGPLDPQKVNKAVDVIERGGRAQTQLIEDLLDTARIISGKLRLEVGPVNLVTVIQAAVQTIYPAADAKGIAIQTDLNPRVGQITGDAARLQQVIWNLLSNAVKFTPPGGRVDLNLERVDPHICVTISDTGKGISADFLPYVFDRFRQADASSTRRYGGLGLGLALVKYLVELHGGTVEVFSEGEGKGATFKVQLPVRAVFGPPETELSPVSTQGLDKAALDGVRVLVVDDEDDARELVRTVIAEYGAEVVAARSAAEAFTLMTTTPADKLPDVIVTDLGLPEEDGYSLLRRLREWQRERNIFIPAIALTAYGRSEDRVHALRAGFQMHVAKPVEPDELVIVISSVVRRSGISGTE